MTVSIIAVLLAVLWTAVSGAWRAARAVRCQASLRAIVEDFRCFADERTCADRGDDRSLRARFRLASFQDSQYAIDEFWAYGEREEITTPDSDGADPMRCASVDGELTLRRHVECTDGAIGPWEHVSYAFNRRLHRAEVIDSRGRPRAVPALLNSSILEENAVPLVFDVDGGAAVLRKAPPIFAAPSLDSRSVYAGDRFWFPALRHSGSMNVGFVDGHVESSSTPLEQSGWRWSYQPRG